jgi:hypothetical protein
MAKARRKECKEGIFEVKYVGICCAEKDFLIYWKQLLGGITIERFMCKNRSCIGYEDKTQYIFPYWV